MIMVLGLGSALQTPFELRLGYDLVCTGGHIWTSSQCNRPDRSEGGLENTLPLTLRLPKQGPQGTGLFPGALCGEKGMAETLVSAEREYVSQRDFSLSKHLAVGTRAKTMMGQW